MEIENSPQPEASPPANNKKRIWILLAVLCLGGIAYLLASSGLFKGALYLDEELKEKKVLSESSSIGEEIKKVKRTGNEVVLDCDVVIAGGGTGGVSAAIASAREGAETCLIEETDWLGGMLTSAGVAAIDGRPDASSGIFYEIIQNIESYYSNLGQKSQIHNCTVSYLCFEPHVGDYILKKMTGKEKNLKVFLNSKINKVYREKDKIVGINFVQDETSYIVNADVTVDATEYGDLMFLGGVDYDLGTDPGSKESLAKRADQCIQPLTYVAILQEQSSPAVIAMPPGYDREKYKCVVKNPACPDSNSLLDISRLLSYGRMPNNKLMINIPSHSYGNDFHATSSNLENYSRKNILEEAKNYSLGFIYFVQSELGMENFGVYDEFGTEDKLAKIPYIRESRRLKGVKRLNEFDIVKAGGEQRADLVEDVIAIGDYPIDLHFCRYGKGDIFEPVAPYQIPYGVTVPAKVDGFLVADKNISVSHIVNGTTRLQPVSMAVGQAVGTAAAMASKQGIEPRNIDTEELQKKLIDAGSNVFFFKDLPAQHWAYQYVAQLAIKGQISGYSDFTFKPDNIVSEADFSKIFKSYLTLKGQDAGILGDLYLSDSSTSPVTRVDAIDNLYQLLKITGKLPGVNNTTLGFSDLTPGTDVYEKVQALTSAGVVSAGSSNFRPNDNLTRAESIVFSGRSADVISANE